MIHRATSKALENPGWFCSPKILEISWKALLFSGTNVGQDLVLRTPHSADTASLGGSKPQESAEKILHKPSKALEDLP